MPPKLSHTRKQVLFGDFGIAPGQEWRRPKWKMLVFVSSTFTDTHRERNLLLSRILPLLKERGKKQGIEVTFVDMRWGVRDENTLDHRTWFECSRELERCRKESTGLYFVSLQGSKYGYRPLPKFVPKKTLENCLCTSSSQSRSVASAWYDLDENSMPPQYVLKNLATLGDADYWDIALPVLREVLANASFESTSSYDLRVGDSVTEWEVQFALSDNDAAHNCIWAHRNFVGGVTKAQDPQGLLFDGHDPAINSKLLNLKNLMFVKFSQGTVREFDVSELTQSLDKITTARGLWDQDGDGVGIAGHELDEMLHHAEWALEKYSLFEGRDALVAEALAAIAMPNSTSTADNDALRRVQEARAAVAFSFDSSMDVGEFLEGMAAFASHLSDMNTSAVVIEGLTSKHSGLCLCLVGDSGCGKTALMAKLAAEMANTPPLPPALPSSTSSPTIPSSTPSSTPPPLRRRPVVIRFCGTSAQSSDGLSLVRSLCQQIQFLLRDPAQGAHAYPPVPDAYREAVDRLHLLLHRHPLALFIDSLDQLSDLYFERSQLSFLEGVEPHVDTRIVVSTLPDLRDPVTGAWVPSRYYGCASCLELAKVPRVMVSPLAVDKPTSTALPPSPSLTPSSLTPPSVLSFVPPLSVAAVPNINTSASPNVNTSASSNSSSSSNININTSAGPSISPSSNSNFNTSSSQCEARQLLGKVLSRDRRTLTVDQWTLALQSMGDNPTVLYIMMAAVLVGQWHSFSPLSELKLEPSVRGVVTQVLARTERHFGVTLTRAALGMLTLARDGLRDDEVEDLLSLDDRVLDDVFQYSAPIIRRLPSHVWLRLRGELKGLLVERSGGCLVWYHRQLREVAMARYSEDMAEKLRWQEIMGRYFGDIVDARTSASRYIARQPLVVKPVSVWKATRGDINIRRCVEAAHNLIQAQLWEECADELCNMEAVCAHIKCGRGHQMLELLGELKEGVAKERATDRVLAERVDHYWRWLRQDVTTLARDPSTQIFVSATSKQPLTSRARIDAINTLEKTRDPAVLLTDEAFAHTTWIRGEAINDKADFDSHQVVILYGHTNSVTFVSLSPCCKFVASCSLDNTLRVWNLLTGNVVAIMRCQYGGGGFWTNWEAKGEPVTWNETTFDSMPQGAETAESSSTSTSTSTSFFQTETPLMAGFGMPVTGFNKCLWAADSSRIFTCSMEPVVRVWEPTLGILLDSWEGHESAIKDMAFSKDQARLFTASFDTTVRVWNVATGACELVCTLHSCPVLWVAVNQRNVVASTSSDATLRIWDGNSGASMICHQKFANAVCWHPNGNYLACLTKKSTILLVDVSTWTLIASFDAGHVVSLLFSLKHNVLITGNLDKSYNMWDLDGTNHRKRDEVGYEHHASLDEPSGTFCITSEQELRIWELDAYFAAPTTEDNGKRSESVVTFNCFALHPDGINMAYALKIGREQYFVAWNVDIKAMTEKIHHPGTIGCMAWHPGGRRIATGRDDGVVMLWDLDSASVVDEWREHQSPVRSVAWTSSGNQLASGGAVDQIICIADMDTREKHVMVKQGIMIASLSWNSDGSDLAWGAYCNVLSVMRWNGTDVSKIELKGHNSAINVVVRSPCEKLFAVGLGNGLVLVLDSVAGSVVASLSAGAVITSLAWNPKAAVLVNGCTDGRVFVWRLESGVWGYSNAFEVSKAALMSTAWTSSGRLITVGREQDMPLCLWDCVKC